MQKNISLANARYRGFLLALLLLGLALPSQAVTWQTAANNPTQPDDYVALDYPLVFVTAPIVEEKIFREDGSFYFRGRYDIGTDVLTATRPSSGNALWALYPDGQVEKLFPLACHEGIDVDHPDTGDTYRLIDTPMGELDNGAVVEPNTSEDGSKVYFSYFHDATDNINHNQGFLSKRGADIYSIDLQPLLDHVNCTPPCQVVVNPTACGPPLGPGSLDLPVQRLTFREYQPSSSKQLGSDRVKAAMNIDMADNPDHFSQPGDYGTVFLHPTEMRTDEGLELVYVSNERRLENSNGGQGKGNYNLNLHIAKLRSDGSLGRRRQFQYYTTTSALSPAPLRNGVAFAYQSTTGDSRNWHIQASDSAGLWSPLIGYGSNQDLFHLGTFCVDTLGDSIGNSEPGDYFLGVHYYNANNEGYGALWKVDLAQTGTNDYSQRNSHGVKPRATSSRKFSLGVTGGDAISGKLNGEYIGKITSPRCGKANELLMTYTPTSANGKEADDNGDFNIYRGHIAYRWGLDDFNPSVDYDPVTGDGLRIVINDSDDDVNLVWPTPVISWQERSGDPQQQFTETLVDKDSAVLPGRPFAQVGTSALYNTDRKPYDCFLSSNPAGKPYNPHAYSSNESDQVIENYDGLTYVVDPSDRCLELDEVLAEDLILGVAVNITGNETSLNYDKRGYLTDGDGTKEAAKLLGVYDVRGQGDQSFQALIPSHTPFEFHLIDKRYGLRLLDVRSWHSLYPQETRTSCGGCHQHDDTKDPIDFAGKVADTQPPLDMVGSTPQITYDASCNPVFTTSANPTETYPEWIADIWDGFNTNCGSCHDPSRLSADPLALADLSFTDESSAYLALKNDRWAHSISGALGSQAFWAARGTRTDGRSDSDYGPDYTFSVAHQTGLNYDLCNDAADAAWVHKFGQWIDNHMPRDTDEDCNSTVPGGKCGVHFDRYHPTADAALARRSCALDKLRFGYWDDSGTVSFEAFLNGNSISTYNGPNGFHGRANLSLALTDLIRVVVTDPSDNRQIYEKTVQKMLDDCRVRYPLPQSIDPTMTPP